VPLGSKASQVCFGMDLKSHFGRKLLSPPTVHCPHGSFDTPSYAYMCLSEYIQVLLRLCWFYSGVVGFICFVHFHARAYINMPCTYKTCFLLEVRFGAVGGSVGAGGAPRFRLNA
jgi:hypothetical protein